MKIGELSRKSGMAASAIRFYEEQGLLPPTSRAANGYREYAAHVMERLHRIQIAKNLGFSLEAIRGFFSDGGECSKEKTLAQTLVRLREIEQLQISLATQHRDLLALRAKLEGSAEDGAAGEPCSRAFAESDEIAGREPVVIVADLSMLRHTP